MRMLRPTTTSGQQGDFGQANPYNGNRDNEERDLGRIQGLHDISATDPRLTNEQRLDQRYANYTFGSDPNYADTTAGRLQTSGQDARSVMGTLGASSFASQLAAQGRAAPEVSFGQQSAALAGAGATTMNQSDLYGRLTAFADQGPGPSQAQAQLNASSAQAMRQQLALAGSGRGAGGGAQAFRQAAANQAQIQGQANAQASVLRAQEEDAWRQRQLQAYGLGGQTLDQQGNLQLGMAHQYGGQAQFQTDAELRAQAQNDQAALGYGQQAIDAYQAGTQAQLGYETEARNNYMAQLQAGMGYESNMTDVALGKRGGGGGTDWLSVGLSTAAAVAPAVIAASDVRNKTHIQGEDLTRTYRALGGNHEDFTDAGWHQPGSAGHTAALESAERRKRMQEEQERREAEKRQKSAGVWGTALQGISKAYEGGKR